MRLVDKWLSISGLWKILGANGAEDYKDVTEYQAVSDQREEIRSGYALGMTGRREGGPTEYSCFARGFFPVRLSCGRRAAGCRRGWLWSRWC